MRSSNARSMETKVSSPSSGAASWSAEAGELAAQLLLRLPLAAQFLFRQRGVVGCRVGAAEEPELFFFLVADFFSCSFVLPPSRVRTYIRCFARREPRSSSP